MGKKRVHELAKELGFTNRDLIEKLQKLGFEVKSHSSTVDEEAVRKALRQEDDGRRGGGRTETPAASSAAPAANAARNIIRRRPKDGEVIRGRPDEAAPETTRVEAVEAVAEAAAETKTMSMEVASVETAPPPVMEVPPAVVPVAVDIAAREPEIAESKQEKQETLAADAERSETSPAPVRATVTETPAQEDVVARPIVAQTTAQARESAADVARPESTSARPVVPAARDELVARDETAGRPATSVAADSTAPGAAPAAAAADADGFDEKRERREARPARPDRNDRKRDEEYDEDNDKPDLEFEDMGISLQDFAEDTPRNTGAKGVRVAPPPPSSKPAQMKKEEEPQSTIVRKIDPNVLKARLNQSKRPEPPKEWGRQELPASPVTELVVRTDASGKKRELVDVRKEAAKGAGKTGRLGQRRREEMSAKDLLEHRRGQVYYPSPNRKRVKGRKARRLDSVAPVGKHPIVIGEMILVVDLAKQMGRKVTEVIQFLMRAGIMASINQPINNEAATLVATEFGYEVSSTVFEEEDHFEGEEMEDDDPDAVLRAPVVTVMGHVDHGKTTLLDQIRKTNVAGGEAGGITQRIAGYQVKTNKGMITFLDTPGHAAFTHMRARGADVTDIVILVVAADDGVMPQTLEALEHARAAEVPIIVAINKIDKPDANPDRVIQQLANHGLVVEDWGGEVLSRRISAKTGEGMDELLELLALQAEIMELKANPDVPARGTVVEAFVDKGRGPVATVLVQEGTLRVGDTVVVGESIGKVRAMMSDSGKRVKEAGPSTPVQLLGLDSVPQPADEVRVATDQNAAREISAYRREKRRDIELSGTAKVSLQDLYARMKKGQQQELKILIKADVQGAVEALRDALLALANDQVRVTIIHGGVGAVVESDVEFARASEAIIVGFSVRPDTKAVKSARALGVEIRTHEVIYEIVDEVRLAMEGLLTPVTEERYLGRAEVRQTFSVPRVGTVAGCAVVDGMIQRSAQVRLIRDGKSMYSGKLSSLKRFKDDVREVKEGFECGCAIEKFNDIRVGDIIEAYELVEVKAVLNEPAAKKPGGRPEARA